jgi:hypothetical protein
MIIQYGYLGEFTPHSAATVVAFARRWMQIRRRYDVLYHTDEDF